MNRESPPVVVLGCGYVGTRLAQSLLADGVTVRVCARRIALLEPLRARGADVHYLDGGRPHQFAPALAGLLRPVVVYSIPGVPGLPQGEGVRRAATAAQRAGASAFIYLSSSAVYGRSELPFTAEWVDEDSPIAIGDADAMVRLADEAALQSIAQSGLRTVILRLGAIYGPAVDEFHAARGARQRLRAGQYKLWDGGRHYFSRIFVDDLVRIIRTAADKAPPGSTYVVGDDTPCLQSEYGTWLAHHLQLPMPPEVDAARAGGPRNIIRGRRLRNAKLKQELGLTLLYPGYREGELAIDAVEQGAPLPPLRLSDQTPLVPNSATKPPASVPDPSQADAPATIAEAVSPAPGPEAVTVAATPSPWPKPVDTSDLGLLADATARGVFAIRLKAGEVAERGPAYVLLSGHAKAQLGGASHVFAAWSAVPAGTAITATEDCVLIQITAPQN
ncbi:MAG TPA: NAD-dependent epimerase/dehydratase family protein [Pseudomonadota bacterium]|nr:NAD-dependent epimerase/dehydratase family protein [Pseudomonadota bacterium]